MSVPPATSLPAGHLARPQSIRWRPEARLPGLDVPLGEVTGAPGPATSRLESRSPAESTHQAALPPSRLPNELEVGPHAQVPGGLTGSGCVAVEDADGEERRLGAQVQLHAAGLGHPGHQHRLLAAPQDQCKQSCAVALIPSASRRVCWLLGWPQSRGARTRVRRKEAASALVAALRLPCCPCTAPALSRQSFLQAPVVASPREGGRACSAMAPGTTRANDAHVLPALSALSGHSQSAPGTPLALRCCVSPSGSSLLLKTIAAPDCRKLRTS